MKRVITAILLVTLASSAFSQVQDTLATDTLRKRKKVSIKVEIDSGSDSTKAKKKTSRFSAGFTLARFDLGLSRYLDQGSFTLSPENSYLEHESWKTHNVGFELFQMGYRFTSNFKVYLGAGIDWTHIRLERNISFQKDAPTLTPVEETVEFKKNRFSSQYLRIPLSFQLRTNDDERGKKFYFVAGPEVGFLLAGKQKQVSPERGKVKVKDDFNFAPFRYGGFARLGYANVGVFAKYYLNDVFAENQGPSDFKNLSFGLTFGF